MLKILSLGAGVQSSVILFMSERGELPKLDHAIFADTGDEPESVYRYLQYLKNHCKTPIHVVSRGYSISQHVRERIAQNRRSDNPPFYAQTETGIFAPINRNCTVTWKIRMIESEMKNILGLSKADRWPKVLSVETWLGISYDERQRLKVSKNLWQRIWHPLIENEWTEDTPPMFKDKPFTRLMCLNWIRKHNLPEPPRSACWHCPFRSDRSWKRLKEDDPSDFERAVQFDHDIRANGNIHGMREQVWLHRTGKPLDQVMLDNEEQDLFSDECSGICGV